MADGGVKRNQTDEQQALLSSLERREQSIQNLQRELELVSRQIDERKQAVQRAEQKRDELVARIRDHGSDLEFLRMELAEAREREALRAREWIVEREAGELPHQDTVMPWARSSSEDRRYRWSLVLTVVAAAASVYAISLVSIPEVEGPQQIQLPERMARLVREEREPPPPPPPIEEPVEEEEIPEPEPETEVAEEQTAQDTPEPEVTPLSEQEVKEKVRTQGILAFRDSFASRASLNTTAQLGAQARVRAIGDDAIDRPERSMVTSNAPGLGSSGINLGDISRDVGGGGTVANVEVARVASTIETEGKIEGPQAGSALAGRTDEDIQIVFDRYKSSLYRLYNRELRRDPRLRGQVVLKLTIEADGSVSSCELQSSNMNAPQLVQQIIDRVLTFDFGPLDDVASVTIIYPIEFMPAG